MFVDATNLSADALKRHTHEIWIDGRRQNDWAFAMTCDGPSFDATRVMPMEIPQSPVMECPRCGQRAARVTGRSAAPSGRVVRCDACGHPSFALVDADGSEQSWNPICPHCRHPETRPLGRSSPSSAVAYFRCDGCARVFNVRSMS